VLVVTGDVVNVVNYAVVMEMSHSFLLLIAIRLPE